MTFTIPNSAKAVIIAAFALVFHFNSFGQTDFRPGYYITLENDTVTGLIDYRGEARNSVICSFKANENSKTVAFKPEDIQGYKYNDSKFYISKTIEIEGEQKPAFVEFLVDGITDLYYYHDLNETFYVLEDQQGKLFKVQKEFEEVQIEGKEGSFVKESHQHIAMLRMAFSDCMEIQPRITNAMLTHKSLINLTTDYHDYVCDDERCVVYEKKLPAVRLELSPVAGSSISSLTFEGGFYSRFSFDQSIQPMYGGSLNLILPRTNEKISFQLDVLYNKTAIEGIYRDYYQLFINSSTLRPSFAAKYNFPKGKIRPTFAVGVIGNYFLQPEYNAIIDNEANGEPNEFDVNEIYMATQLYGGLAQLGCNYHFIKNVAMFTNVRYSFYSGLESDETDFIKTKISALDVSFGMYF